MPDFQLPKTELDKIVHRVVRLSSPELLSSVDRKLTSIIPQIADQVRQRIPIPVDGQDGKDAEITEEIISQITVRVLERTNELIQVKNGKDGIDGQNGKDGRDGKDGRKGDKGDQGEKGDRGERGEKGDRGEAGRNYLLTKFDYDEIAGLVEPKIRIPKDGKDYILTDSDKRFISSLIPIPKDGIDGKNPDVKEVLDAIKISDYILKTDLDKILKQFKQDLALGRIELPRSIIGGGGGVTPAQILAMLNRYVDSENLLLNYLYEETSSDDEGINCIGEFHVGQPGNGKEAVFGEGDSHTNGMVVYTTADSVTYTDATELAKYRDGVSYTGFSGTLSPGGIDYIGSDNIICGLKFVVLTPVIIGAVGDINAEYWNGSSWADMSIIATLADYPYTASADRFAFTIDDFQVRFSDYKNQVKTTVNGTEKYWVRFRIVNTITQSAAFDQIKIHTNRFEVNKDGSTEYFGDGIYRNDLLIHWNLTQELSGFSPLSSNVQFADNITLIYADNELPNGQTSGRGGYIVIPEGMDTSRPVIGEILFYPDDNTAGDILWEIDTYQSRVGDVLSASNISTTNQETTVISLNSQNTIYNTTVEVPVTTLVPGEILSFGFKRIGADALDTYSGNIVLINVRAIGNFYKP